MSALYLVKGQEESKSAEELVSYYCENCGFRPLPWMLAEFRQLLAEGFEPLMLEEVINRTARAPRPSWAYFSAILQHCRSVNAYDVTGLSFRATRRNWREQSAQELPY